MRLAQAALIWAALAAAICVPVAARSDERSARMARSGLHPGRIRRDHRAGSRARSAFADCRISAGTVGLSRAACASLDRRRAGRRGDGPRRGPLDHQSAGHDRRASLHIADAVLPLRCDRHVGDLRRRAFGGTPPAIGTGAANVAHRSYGARGGHRRRQRGPCHADRGDDGDDVEGGSLRAGHRGDHKSHG